MFYIKKAKLRFKDVDLCMRDVIFIGYIKAELFDLSGAVSNCKPKVLDVLLLDGGGQCAIILSVTNYAMKVIIK